MLQVEDLSISFRTAGGLLPVTRGVSFSIAPGERLGVVGESGCGKTVTGLSILRLLPAHWDAPRPQALLTLAGRASFGPGPLAPVYLRASDAEDNLAAIAAGRGLTQDEAQAILSRGSRTLS